MKDWNTQRLEINRQIRSVLVCYFIDLGKLSVHVYPAKVSIRGSLVKMTGAPGNLTAEILRQMFSEIERIQGVRRILTCLDNWVQRSAHDWVCTTARPSNKRNPELEQETLDSAFTQVKPASAFQSADKKQSTRR